MPFILRKLCNYATVLKNEFLQKWALIETLSEMVLVTEIQK